MKRDLCLRISRLPKTITFLPHTVNKQFTKVYSKRLNDHTRQVLKGCESEPKGSELKYVGNYCAQLA